MSFDRVLAVVSIVFGLAGTGIALLWPTRRWVGWGFIVTAVAIAVLAGIWALARRSKISDHDEETGTRKQQDFVARRLEGFLEEGRQIKRRSRIISMSADSNFDREVEEFLRRNLSELDIKRYQEGGLPALEGIHKEVLAGQSRQQSEHHLFLEVDEGPWTTWHAQNPEQTYSEVLVMHAPSTSESDPAWLWVKADIRLRFDNRDALHRARADKLVLLIRREAPEKQAEEVVLQSQLETEGGKPPNVGFLFVEPRDKSQYHRFRSDHHLFDEWYNKLDANCFLRIKMVAAGQRPYCVDLDVDWEQALKNESPWEPGRVTIRKLNSC